jgi:hypothetical protein
MLTFNVQSGVFVCNNPVLPSPSIHSASIVPDQLVQNLQHLHFNNTERMGIQRIYNLLIAGHSYGELERLVHMLPDLRAEDIANAKLALGTDPGWIKGHFRVNQSPPAIPRIPINVNLRSIHMSFDAAKMMNQWWLVGVSAGNLYVQVVPIAVAMTTGVLHEAIKTMLKKMRSLNYSVEAYSLDRASAHSEALRALLQAQIGQESPIQGREHAASAENMIGILKPRLSTLLATCGRIIKPNVYQLPAILLYNTLCSMSLCAISWFPVTNRQ